MVNGRKAAFLRLDHSGKRVSEGWHSAAGRDCSPCRGGFRELDAALSPVSPVGLGFVFRAGLWLTGRK